MASFTFDLAFLLLCGVNAYQRAYATCQPTFVYGICDFQPDPRFEVHVHGTVDIRQQIDCEGDDGHTEFWLRATGLPTTDVPVERGFHVHQFADFSDGCTSAGPHYNPETMTHGALGDEIRHVGDLGNVWTNTDGTIDTKFSDVKAGLVGEFPVLGRSFVIHEKRDDLGQGGNDESLLTGNAGGRYACCVIGYANGSRWQ